MWRARMEVEKYEVEEYLELVRRFGIGIGLSMFNRFASCGWIL